MINNTNKLESAAQIFHKTGLNKENARVLAALFLKHPGGLSLSDLMERIPDLDPSQASIDLMQLSNEGYLMKLPAKNDGYLWQINPDFVVGQLRKQLQSLDIYREVIKEIIILSEEDTDNYEVLHEFTGTYIAQTENLINKWYKIQK